MYFDEYVMEQVVMDKEDYDYAVDLIQCLVDEIYERGDIDDVEHYLEELTHVFGMKIPSTSPVLIKKPSIKEAQTDRLLKQWVGYTRAYAEMMKN